MRSHHALHRSFSLEHLREIPAVRLDDADDHAKKPESAPENLHDQHLHKHVRLLRIAEGAAAPAHAHTDPAEKIREPHREAHAEEAIPGGDAGGLPTGGDSRNHELGGALDLVRHDDRHNHTVDRDGLTEDDAHQILRADPRGLDGGTHQAGAGEEDPPGRAEHREPQSESDADIGPEEGTDRSEHAGDVRVEASQGLRHSCCCFLVNCGAWYCGLASAEKPNSLLIWQTASPGRREIGATKDEKLYL